MMSDYKIIRMGRGGTVYARVPDGIDTGDLYMGSKKRHSLEVAEWQARIATLEAENKAYDLRMDNDATTIAELQADHPPDGYPSWEDWLAARGFSIILEQASEDRRSWQVFDFDGEIGDPHADYPTALAAAMKEAGDA